MQKRFEPYNILLSGVGGTGIIAVAQILGVAAIKQNLKVRISEIHGMAVRGGTVNAHVRIGKEVYSPLIMDGQADLLIGFELAETLRDIIKISRRGFVIVNNYTIIPPTTLLGYGSYPVREEILRFFRLFTKNILTIDALQLAKQAGHSATMSTVLVGAAAAIDGFPLKMEAIRESTKSILGKRLLQENLKALELGYNYAKSKLKNILETN